MKAIIISHCSKNAGLPGTQIPDGLIKHENVQLLKKQINNLKQLNINDIKIIVGKYGLEWIEHNINEIKKIHSNIIINSNNDYTGKCRDLLLGLHDIDEDVIVLNDDIIFGKNVLKELINFYKDNSTILTKDLVWFQHDYNFVYTKFHKVLDIGRHIYSPKATAFSGAFKIVKNDIKTIRKVIENMKRMENNEKVINELCKIKDVYEYRSDYWETINKGSVDYNF